MDSRVFFLVAAVIVTCNAFSPTVIFSCSSGPEYNVTLTNAVIGGVIFVENYCAQQSISSNTSTHIFNSTACMDGGVPPLGTDFYIVIQEYASFSQDSDVRVKANCTADLQSQTQVVNITSTDLPQDNGSDSITLKIRTMISAFLLCFVVSNDISHGWIGQERNKIFQTAEFTGGTTFDETSTDSIAPTLSIDISDTTGTVSSGTVGDAVNVTLSIANAFEASTFGFRVSTVEFSGTTIVEAGCSSYGFFASPGLPSGGSLVMPLTLVRPMSASDLDLTAATLSITLTVEICNGSCSAYTCSSRRKRSDDEGSTIGTKKTYATLLVYPPGQRPDESSSIDAYMKNDVSLEDVCFSRTPMVAVLICLALALIVCVTISAWMYCKLRYAGNKKSADGFSNNGYKA